MAKKRSLYDEEGWGLNAGVYLMEGGPMNYFGAKDAPRGPERDKLKWYRMMMQTSIPPSTYEQIFGPRTQYFSDSEGRRLQMWRQTLKVGDREIFFWLNAHNHRGSSMEIQANATGEEALAVVKYVHGKIEEAGLVPPAALMDFSNEG